MWQPEVAMFLTCSQYSELQNQEWETSLKLNWTKAVYQRSSPPMATQVQESILVSKTSIQCTVEFLPKMMCTLLVLSFLGLVERFLHKHNKYAMYTCSFLFRLYAKLNTCSPACLSHSCSYLVLWCLFAQLRFFYKK